MKKYLRRRRKKWLTFNFLVVGPATYFIFFEQYGKMCFVIFREREKKMPGSESRVIACALGAAKMYTILFDNIFFFPEDPSVGYDVNNL